MFAYRSGLDILISGQSWEPWFIAAMVFLLLIVTTPEPVEFQPERLPTNWYFYNAWYGALPLWKAFWPFLLVFQLIFILVDSLISMGKLSVLIWDISLMIFFLSGIWWVVSIWCCSPNTRRSIWAASARFASVVLILILFYRLNLRIYQPRDLFSCGEMFNDYFSCF